MLNSTHRIDCYRPAAALRLGVVALCALMATALADTHVVRKGDTLSDIAHHYGVTTAAIAAANGVGTDSVLQIGQKLTLPPGAARESSYVVRSGDNLAHIAKRHGVSVKALVARNDISRPDRLRVGQELIIPGSVVEDSQFAAMKKRLDKTPVRSGRWRYIVVHHSASEAGTAEGIDRYHRERRHMANGLAYHFVIGNGNGMPDGHIAVGHRWTKQLDGGHLASDAQNRVALGICLVGNFNETRPTPRQMQSLQALSRYLMQRCALSTSAIRTHRQINSKPTACPGTRFPTDSFVGSLR